MCRCCFLFAFSHEKHLYQKMKALERRDIQIIAAVLLVPMVLANVDQFPDYDCGGFIKRVNSIRELPKYEAPKRGDSDDVKYYKNMMRELKTRVDQSKFNVEMNEEEPKMLAHYVNQAELLAEECKTAPKEAIMEKETLKTFYAESGVGVSLDSASAVHSAGDEAKSMAKSGKALSKDKANSNEEQQSLTEAKSPEDMIRDFVHKWKGYLRAARNKFSQKVSAAGHSEETTYEMVVNSARKYCTNSSITMWTEIALLDYLFLHHFQCGLGYHVRMDFDEDTDRQHVTENVPIIHDLSEHNVNEGVKSLCVTLTSARRYIQWILDTEYASLMEEKKQRHQTERQDLISEGILKHAYAAYDAVFAKYSGLMKEEEVKACSARIMKALEGEIKTEKVEGAKKSNILGFSLFRQKQETVGDSAAKPKSLGEDKKSQAVKDDSAQTPESIEEEKKAGEMEADLAAISKRLEEEKKSQEVQKIMSAEAKNYFDKLAVKSIRAQGCLFLINFLHSRIPQSPPVPQSKSHEEQPLMTEE